MMGSAEILSTLEINHILSDMKEFKGTFPADRVLVENKNSCQAFIVNIDTYDKSGSHWTALLIEDGKCLFFDPLGLECVNIDLLNQLKALGFISYTFNRKQIQPIKNNNCGYYCIAFIVYMLKEKNFTSFLSYFDENSDANNEICYEIILKYI